MGTKFKWYLHRNKIAHLDLKPQNILITEYLDIKLIDFSVSVEYGKLNSEEIKLPYVGTPFFMPPEIIKRMKINPAAIKYHNGWIYIFLYILDI